MSYLKQRPSRIIVSIGMFLLTIITVSLMVIAAQDPNPSTVLLTGLQTLAGAELILIGTMIKEIFGEKDTPQ